MRAEQSNTGNLGTTLGQKSGALPCNSARLGLLALNGQDTVLTYPGGTVTLVNVNLGPVASQYPWLQWSDIPWFTLGPRPLGTDMVASVTSDDADNAGLSQVDETLNLIGISQDAASPDW